MKLGLRQKCFATEERLERILEIELFGLVNSDLRFLPYRKVFARFGFGLPIQSLILSQIFPIQNYFGEGAQPCIRIRKGHNSKKPTKRYRVRAPVYEKSWQGEGSGVVWG